MPIFRSGAHLSMTLVTTVTESDPMAPRESRAAMSFSPPRQCSISRRAKLGHGCSFGQSGSPECIVQLSSVLRVPEGKRRQLAQLRVREYGQEFLNGRTGFGLLI